MRLVLKATRAERVRPHSRKGRSVRGYMREVSRLREKKRFTAEERKVIDEKWPAMRAMAWRSVGHQFAVGRHIMFPGDAAEDAAVEGMLAYLELKPTGQDWRKAIQPRIAGAVKNHLTWERTHGITGSTYLDKQWREAKGAEKERLSALMVMVQRDMTRLASRSAWEELVHGQEVKDREDSLKMLAARWNIDLEKIVDLAASREVKPRGKARSKEAVLQDLAIFEDRWRGRTTRETAKIHKVSVGTVQNAYRRITEAMRAVAKAERREKKEAHALQKWEERAIFSKALRIDDIGQDRLQRALARHIRGLDLGLKGRFIERNRNLLAELLLESRHYWQ